jgi:hypothetical protein
MSSQSHRSSAEIEREVETTRAGLTNTVEELKDRMSPTRVLDQVVDFASEHGGREVIDNVGGAVRSNPIPALLIGAGIAWLLATKATGARSERTQLAGMRRRGGTPRWPEQHDWGEEDLEDHVPSANGVGRAAAAVGTAASNTAYRAASAVSSAASDAYETVAGAAGKAASVVGDAAYSAGRSAGDTALSYGRSASGTAYEYGRKTADRALAHAEDYWRTGQRNVGGVFEQQPLVAGAIGLAIGAALGAAIPSTDVENRMMGEGADELKLRARELAAEQYESVKETAGQLYEGVRNEAAALSPVPGAIAGQVERAVAAAANAGNAAKESVEEALGDSGAERAPVGGPHPVSSPVGKVGTTKAS